MSVGLDTVELVMDIEERFGINFSDEAASKILTVEDLHKFVLSQLPENTLHRVWDGIVEDLQKFGVPRDKIRPEAQIVRDLGLD